MHFQGRGAGPRVSTPLPFKAHPGPCQPASDVEQVPKECARHQEDPGHQPAAALQGALCVPDAGEQGWGGAAWGPVPSGPGGCRQEETQGWPPARVSVCPAPGPVTSADSLQDSGRRHDRAAVCWDSSLQPDTNPSPPRHAQSARRGADVPVCLPGEQHGRVRGEEGSRRPCHRGR